MSTITIARAERDLIHEYLGCWMPTDEKIPFDDRAAAGETIGKLQRLLAFHDELGWRSDDPRQTFSVTVDDSLVEVVRLAQEHAVDTIGWETEYRETHILKLRPTRFGTSWEDDFPTIEEATASVDGQIRLAEERQRASDLLLARLDAEAVPA